ncbi:MAG: hypothetical protein ABIY51_02800 [Ferruginibacter sp.]
MGDNFFVYLQQMEMMAFFSGYPLVYFFIQAFIKPTVKNNIIASIPSLLSFGYALAGTAYLGFKIKNLYPNYAIQYMQDSVQLPFLFTWALLSLLFWKPSISKIKWLSMLHSLVFFYFLLQDLTVQIVHPSQPKEMLNNDMKIYALSILLNIITIIIVTLINYLFQRIKKH